MKEESKEKLIGATGSISGAASILGSWQICHNVCLGLIALLGVIGITVIGMPLAFFTKIVVPMWTIAVVLLGVVIWFYIKKKCISKNLIMVNSGLIIVGTPFQSLQSLQVFFWTVGGILIVLGIAFFIRDKINKKREKHEN